MHVWWVGLISAGYAPTDKADPKEWSGIGVGLDWSVVLLHHRPVWWRSADADRFCCDGSAQYVVWHFEADRKENVPPPGFSPAPPSIDEVRSRFKWWFAFEGVPQPPATEAGFTVVASNTRNTTLLFEP
jgi:hypothetical protein